jgi:hypothetical protein
VNAPIRTPADSAAWELLDSWLGGKPGRSVKRMVRTPGPLYTVVLSGRKEYTSTTQLTLESAVRTALGIAYAEGDK